MSGNDDHHRHFDQIDYRRMLAAIRALRELCEGSEREAWQILRREYEQRRDEGDLLLRPETLNGPQDVIRECSELFEILCRLSEGSDTIEVSRDCIVVQQNRAGVPELSWTRFCDACQVSHQYAGWQEDADQQGSLGVPVRLPNGGPLHRED